MASLHNSKVGSGAPRPQRGQPQLPAFCRTRRSTVTVRVTTLQRLQWLLWLAVALQLSSLLLLLAGPTPPRLGPRPAVGSGAVAAACQQRQSSAALPSLSTS